MTIIIIIIIIIIKILIIIIIIIKESLRQICLSKDVPLKEFTHCHTKTFLLQTFFLFKIKVFENNKYTLCLSSVTMYQHISASTIIS